MTTAYPSSLDTLTNPNTSDPQNGPSHSGQHSNANDAIEAIEAKVGISGSAVTTTLDYRDQNGMPGVFSGAGAATRFVGGRASVPPTGSTWAVGDFVTLQSGGFAVCTVAGTPGTWVTITAAGQVAQQLPDYVIYKSGSNYLARNTSTGVDDYTNTNAASVVQSAHDALGRAGLIELKRGITYSATSQVILSQAGVMVRSTEQSGEDMSTLWQLTSSLTSGQAAFRMTGTGAGLGGISVDANANADYAVDMRGSGQMFFGSNTKNANVANFYVDGPNGAQRCMFWDLRSDNGAASGSINYKFDGPDHIAWGIRATGAATNGYALWCDTSRLTLASGHITSNGPAAGCVYLSGDENRWSDLYLDTGPSLANGQAHVTIASGNGNYLQALIQNASTQTAVNITATALVSGTTYRFTCSSSHGYVAGNSVWLEGFASSTGFFNGTTNGNVLVTNVSDSTHFDADLGASTTFTDSVGTSKAITKYGLLFTKISAGDFCQGNEVHLTFQGKGAGVNNGEFYYAVGFLDENGNDVSNFARFAANRIHASAANTTRFSNVEASWGTTTNADKIIVDAYQYQGSTTTPMTWRTRAQGKTAASTASSWTVNHGLAGTPKNIQVTPAAALTNQVCWVSGVTSTQFVINASSSITNGTFYWMAEM